MRGIVNSQFKATCLRTLNDAVKAQGYADTLTVHSGLLAIHVRILMIATFHENAWVRPQTHDCLTVFHRRVEEQKQQ